MALALFSSIPKKKRDQMVAIDLGGRTTKAVHLIRRSENYLLARYLLMDAPIYEKGPSVELLGEHLKAICTALEPKTKFVTLAVSVNDSIVRHAEVAPMPVEDILLILKNNSKVYLQQDLPNHVFDLYIVPPRASAKESEAAKSAPTPQKLKILVAAARKQLIDDYQTAIKNIGMVPAAIVPGLVGPVNAFEMALPEIFQKEAVALVDIGFKSTSICILHEGELALSRVVAIGGDRLTTGLVEVMNISYAEAEGIKIGMPNEVQQALEGLLIPLGRELRASIDFFEHQRDKPVTAVYLTGASARSEFIVHVLQNELVAPCKAWDPTRFLQMALPSQQANEIGQTASALTVAIGAAMAAF